jgi:hypothetical protein
MDERLFIKEQKSQSRNQLILIVSAVALVILGLGGMVVLLTSNNNSPSNSVTPPPVAANPEANDPEPTPVNPTPLEPDPVAPEPTPPINPEPQTPPATADYKAPADSTKIHVYFPKASDSSGILNPVLRDKPSTNVLSFGISQVVAGPNADEKAAGLTSTWAFTGSSTCDRNVTYKFNITNSILRLELCREFSGSNAKLFISALDTTAKQIANIKKAVVLKPDGNCLDTADKSCLN